MQYGVKVSGKRGATADKLLQILKGYYSAYGTEVQKEAFIRAVDTFKEEASHVRISASKQPYTIKLTKTGNHVRLLPFDGEKQTISLNEGSGYNPVMKHEQRIGFQFDKYGKEDTTVPEETLVVSMNYKEYKTGGKSNGTYSRREKEIGQIRVCEWRRLFGFLNRCAEAESVNG